MLQPICLIDNSNEKMRKRVPAIFAALMPSGDLPNLAISKGDESRRTVHKSRITIEPSTAQQRFSVNSAEQVNRKTRKILFSAAQSRKKDETADNNFDRRKSYSPRRVYNFVLITSTIFLQRGEGAITYQSVDGWHFPRSLLTHFR